MNCDVFMAVGISRSAAMIGPDPDVVVCHIEGYLEGQEQARKAGCFRDGGRFFLFFRKPLSQNKQDKTKSKQSWIGNGRWKITTPKQPKGDAITGEKD